MVTRVFLDQISSFAHLPEDGRSKHEPWRNTLVQPVTIDIEHIQVPTKILLSPPDGCRRGQKSSLSSSSSLLYPDGSVALELREQISRQVRLTVKDVNVDFDDVRIRDLQRKKQRKKKKRTKIHQ
mmetsp:Transcript_23658/g.29803  ORF Transcript_23658/g.29803 Transcript_23658/m.29803 type:complete len:125 (-) Transcript_23658:84-458(-)